MIQLSIRTRLILAFLGVVLLSLSGITLVVAISNTRGTQQENERQLSTVASYKGQSVREWTNSLSAELATVLVGENIIPNIQAVLNPDSTEDARTAAANRSRLRTRLVNLLVQSQNYDEFMLLDQSGRVVVATARPREGSDFSARQFFLEGQKDAYISTPEYSRGEGLTLLFASYPIQTAGGQLVGVLAGRAKTARLDTLFNDQTGFREPGQTYLAGLDGQVIAGPVITWRGKIVAGLQQAFERVGWPGPQPQVADFSNLDSQAVTAAYLSLPELRGVLVIEQTRRDLVRSQLATLMVNLSVMLASAILALYIALVATRSIALPVIDLVDVATHIASTARQGGEAGPAGAPAESTRASLETAGQDLQERTGGRKDEIGALGSAFYAMTVQLSGLIGGLEAIVAERTRQLETRSAYLEASADISRVTTSILDPERLVEQVVELIRDRFDLYYVGLFLPDPEGRWAVLRSGTGEAGQRMLARSHRLRIEPTSMIGWCISNAQARIAQVAGEDEVRAPNPDLPETRSEAALPLRARGQVIGALSVQSTRPMAFDSASLAVLQTMADQLAIAIENAQLYATSQQALEAQRRAYAVSAHSEWRDWARLRSGLSVRSTPEGPQALPAEAAAWRPEMLQAAVDDRAVADGERLAIPIRVRGAVIGVIGASRPAPSGQPTPGQTNAQDLAFLETIAEQLGVALDSARLYAETRQRSEQDRLVDEITGRMRATLDLRSVLETAAREMRQALNLAEVEVRLSPPAGANGGPDDR